ncbi:hypothetical protein [Chitinophaga barathri]|nr:hypothetical protein [Chitinophaga barathri]
MKKIYLTYCLLFYFVCTLHAQNSFPSTGPVTIGANSPFSLQVAGASRYYGIVNFGEEYDPIAYGKGIQISRPADQGDNAFHLSFIRSWRTIAGMGFLRNSSTFAIQNAADNSTNSGIFLAETGNVGIDINTPTQKFMVNGNISLGNLGDHLGVSLNDRFTYDTKYQPHYGMQWVMDSWTAAGPTLWMSGYGGMKFFTLGLERISVADNGNVGIGTSAPTNYKLAVEGTFAARKVKVTQEVWADFVFDSTYVLPPLKDVESHVKTYRHLSGIPAAEEIQQQGLDIGDMQQRQMQKIEELTLYLIDQNKKVEMQQQLILKQQQELLELGKRLKELERKQSK